MSESQLEPEPPYKHKRLIKFIGFAILATAAIAPGFSGDVSMVKQCQATVTMYVTAQYSDGEDSTWSEPASEVFTAITVNGELYNRNFDFETKVWNQSHYPPWPKQWQDIDKKDFDTYRSNKVETLRILVKKSDGQVVTIDEPIEKAPSCISNLNGRIYAKSWYGFAYGSDM